MGTRKLAGGVAGGAARSEWGLRGHLYGLATRYGCTERAPYSRTVRGSVSILSHTFVYGTCTVRKSVVIERALGRFHCLDDYVNDSPS